MSTETPPQQPIETAELSDAEVILLDLGDPYMTVCWDQVRITAAERSLSTRRLELIQFIRRRVLNEAGARQWEAGLDATFVRHCSLSTELQLLDRVLPLIRRAEGGDRSVWFIGD